MKKSILTTALAISAIAFALPAAAQQTPSPWYVRGAFGQSIYDLDGSGGNKDTSFNLGVGYAYSKSVSIEFGHANFGRFSSFDLKGEAKSIYIGPVFSVPISDVVSVYARAALASTSRQSSFSRFATSETKSELLAGIGLGYRFAANMTATLEYQALTDSDVSAINIGARINF